jgi:hypothetical protein
MKALVLAGGLPQITLIKELQSRGVTAVLADGSDNAIARPYADAFYKVNIFDIDAVRDIAEKEQVDFLITCCADQVLLVVAQVSELLGLPWYIDYEGSWGFRYKTTEGKEYWFPFAGKRDAKTGEISGAGGGAQYHTRNTAQTFSVTESFAWGNPSTEFELNRPYGSSVRCIKEN